MRIDDLTTDSVVLRVSGGVLTVTDNRGKSVLYVREYKKQGFVKSMKFDSSNYYRVQTGFSVIDFKRLMVHAKDWKDVE